MLEQMSPLFHSAPAKSKIRLCIAVSVTVRRLVQGKGPLVPHLCHQIANVFLEARLVGMKARDKSLNNLRILPIQGRWLLPLGLKAARQHVQTHTNQTITIQKSRSQNYSYSLHCRASYFRTVIWDFMLLLAFLCNSAVFFPSLIVSLCNSTNLAQKPSM